MTIGQLKAKLFSLPNEFNKAYNEKRYAEAKHIYETARNIAVFMELPDVEMIKLFGGRAYEHEDNGLFSEMKVQRCYKELLQAKSTSGIDVLSSH